MAQLGQDIVLCGGYKLIVGGQKVGVFYHPILQPLRKGVRRTQNILKCIKQDPCRSCCLPYPLIFKDIKIHPAQNEAKAETSALAS